MKVKLQRLPFDILRTRLRHATKVENKTIEQSAPPRCFDNAKENKSTCVWILADEPQTNVGWARVMNLKVESNPRIFK